MVNKELMRQRFSRNLSTYRSNAVVQDKMAGRLVQFVKAKSGNNFPVILEIGCGEGLLTEKLIKAYSYDSMYINDIVPECSALAEKFSPDVQFIPGDAEETDIFPGNIDLVISNASFQWFHDLEGFIKKICDRMKSGGLLAFSTFGKQHFAEFAKLGFPSLHYFDFEVIKELLSPAFDLIYCKEEQEILFFTTPREVLRHLKLTGVNSVARKKWTKGKIAHFERSYKKGFLTRKGVKLTYNPYYFIGRKKG